MDRIQELATKYRRAMLRLGATDIDFIACGIEPPPTQEYVEIAAEFRKGNDDERPRT